MKSGQCCSICLCSTSVALSEPEVWRNQAARSAWWGGERLDLCCLSDSSCVVVLSSVRKLQYDCGDGYFCLHGASNIERVGWTCSALACWRPYVRVWMYGVPAQLPEWLAEMEACILLASNERP
eukprot:286683-Amphidinium_carterae.1